MRSAHRAVVDGAVRPPRLTRTLTLTPTLTLTLTSSPDGSEDEAADGADAQAFGAEDDADDAEAEPLRRVQKAEHDL